MCVNCDHRKAHEIVAMLNTVFQAKSLTIFPFLLLLDPGPLGVLAIMCCFDFSFPFSRSVLSVNVALNCTSTISLKAILLRQFLIYIYSYLYIYFKTINDILILKNQLQITSNNKNLQFAI